MLALTGTRIMTRFTILAAAGLTACFNQDGDSSGAHDGSEAWRVKSGLQWSQKCYASVFGIDSVLVFLSNLTKNLENGRVIFMLRVTGSGMVLMDELGGNSGRAAEVQISDAVRHIQHDRLALGIS
jgi:hypothetical protein